MSSFDELLGDEPVLQAESSREIKETPVKQDMPIFNEPEPEPEAIKEEPIPPVKKKRASKSKEVPETILIAGRWDRAVAIRKINEARVLPGMTERLGESMKLPTALQLIKKTDAELNEIVTEMELHLSSRNGLASVLKDHVLPNVLHGYEGVLVMLKVPVDGVAQVLLNDPEFIGDIEELIWKRVSYSNWPPEIRIIITIAMTTFKQYNLNKVIATANAPIDITEINARYQGI